MDSGEHESGGNRAFPTTCWSFISRALDPTSPDYARHAERLVELYWRPVYYVMRHAWSKSHDDAKDLTQDFFSSIILDRALLQDFPAERRSFRAFLRVAIKRFVIDSQREAQRQKRGGGIRIASLESLPDAVLEAVPDLNHRTPEEIFDLTWKKAVMSEAVAQLEQRLAGHGRAAAFEVFRRYDWEGDGDEVSYAQLGDSLSLSVPQVKRALMQARSMFREIVIDLVRAYVDDPGELSAELNTLFKA